MPDLYELALSLVMERFEANVLGSDVTVTELIKSLQRTAKAAMDYEIARKEAKQKRQAVLDAETLMATRTEIEADELAEAEMHEVPDELEGQMMKRSKDTNGRWKGFVQLICNAYFSKRMVWYPLDRYVFPFLCLHHVVFFFCSSILLHHHHHHLKNLANVLCSPFIPGCS